jgi:hypothetical protein
MLNYSGAVLLQQGGIESFCFIPGGVRSSACHHGDILVAKLATWMANNRH